MESVEASVHVSEVFMAEFSTVLKLIVSTRPTMEAFGLSTQTIDCEEAVK